MQITAVNQLARRTLLLALLLLPISLWSAEPDSKPQSNPTSTPKKERQPALPDLKGSFLFGVQFGQHYFDDQFFGANSIRDRATLGLRLGYAFYPHFDFEIPFAYVPTRAGAADIDLFTVAGTVVGNLWHRHWWTPYALVGLGDYATVAPALNLSRHELDLVYGAGLKWFFYNYTALRTEVKAHTLLTDPGTDLEWTLGLVVYADFFKSRDRDKDSIPDSVDQCPTQAEDRDGFQDSDGCPDLDNDGDGIPDKSDKAPNDAEDVDGFEDADGAPDLDNDKDGIADLNDNCPNQAEDKDSFEDHDGCPENDNDLDGIPDSKDLAPNDAEDKDNFQDEDGIPDPDNDNDGVKDIDDKCPNELETVNGYADQDGCPDTKLEKFSGVVPGINFATGSAIIDRTSYPIIDEAAIAINEHPNVQVLIEGHTDSVGSTQANLKLSKDRAESVRQYMIAKGVSPFRIRIIGYGEGRPVASNATPTGRAANRRMEFKFTQPTTPNAPAVKPSQKPTAKPADLVIESPNETKPAVVNTPLLPSPKASAPTGTPTSGADELTPPPTIAPIGIDPTPPKP